MVSLAQFVRLPCLRGGPKNGVYTFFKNTLFEAEKAQAQAYEVFENAREHFLLIRDRVRMWEGGVKIAMI